jgi:hypothetical protein
MKPNKNDEDLVAKMTVVAILVLIAIGLATCALAGDSAWMAAAAQGRQPVADTDGQDMSPAVVLARVCTKEASFTGYADCPPIAAVLLRVGRGDVVRGARLYSRKVFDPTRLGRRPWIAFLRADATVPRNWPANISWRYHGPHWRAMVQLAQNVLGQSGERPEPPCAPDHWGDRLHDAERARARGWIELDCGPTLNSYWQVPPRRAPPSRTTATTVRARDAGGRFRTP